jgi:formylglycine-generating enzyme required for sulfatase activity
MLMPRPPLRSFVLTWFVAVAACGGGGGGGGPIVEPPQQDLVVDLGVATTRGSAVITFEAPAPVFSAGAVSSGVWSAGGVAYGSSTWIALTTARLATVVPRGLPPGNYDVEVAILGGKARARAAVAPTPWTSDPEGDVQQFATETTARLATLRGQLTSLRDPALATSLIADLDRLELLRSSFAAMALDASLAEKNAFELLLLATPQLDPGPLTPPASAGPLADPESMRQQVRASVEAWRTAAAALAIGRGLAATEGDDLLATGLAVAGGVQMVQAMVGAANAYDRRFAFDGDPNLLVGIAPSATSSAASVGTLEPLSWLVAGSPHVLRAEVALRGLSAADRQLTDVRVQGVFAAADEAALLQATVTTAVTGVVATPFPSPLPTPVVGVQVLPGNVLTLAQQSNPLLQLALLDDRLVLVGGSANAPASSVLTFRLDAGAFGVATQTVTLDVLRVRDGMLPILSGTYVRGSGLQAQWLPWTIVELPLADVTISRPFWMGRCEVTQAEYAAMTGSQPSFFVGSDRPVDNVRWHDAVAYCEALSASEAAAGRLPPGYVYRLPTEAEWEYCCRAGTVSEWSSGMPPTCAQANFFQEPSYCVAGGATAPVGTRTPNPWGLCDMHGNVLEWCADAWNGQASYAPGAAVDPFVATGPLRVLRGGSYASSLVALRSAHRTCAGPNESTSAIGFRVVCAPLL